MTSYSSSSAFSSAASRGQAWYQQEETAANNLFGLVETISTLQGFRVAAFMRYAALYGNFDTMSWASSIYGRPVPDVRLNRVTFNIIQSMVDTVVAKHAATQPQIEVLTEGGNWDKQVRAKKSTKLLAGEFDRLKLYRLAPLVLRDSLIFGDGYLKFYSQHNKVHVERVFPGEIIIDEADAINGQPRQAFQVRFIDREVAKACWPDAKFEIETASAHELGALAGPSTANMIKIIEAWHLPSAPGAKDGKHAIVINNKTLVYEDWQYDCFPFCRISWSPAMQGWYGQGLADQLMGIQLELNKLLRRVQLSMHLMSVPYYLVEVGSKITKTHLNNEVGHIVEYLGSKPEARVNQSVHPEVFEQIERLFSRAYELAGISPLEAQAKKPVGLDSRPALAEYADIASERHAFFSMSWQEFFRDCSWQIFRCCSEIHSETGEYKTRGVNKKVLEPLKWSDCELENDDYTFKLSAANLLPTTPAGKKNFVQDLTQAGVFTPDQALRLLQFPDIEAITGEMTAAEDDIDWCIYKMLVEGEYTPPEPFQDIQKAIKRVTAEYLKARQAGASEDRLELLRMFLRDCTALMPPAAPPGPPGPPVGP